MIVETDALNDVQRDAVVHADGPVLIFAGAGSGKTRVLTHRIAYLIRERKVFPDRILTVTFTNKAANELRSRLEVMIGSDARDIWSGTFHSICVRILRRDGRKIDLQPREFQLLEYLMRNAGQSVTRTMLLEKVWEYHFDPQTNVIDVHISRLRSKIDKGFDRPMLQTVRGAGYRLEA